MRVNWWQSSTFILHGNHWTEGDWIVNKVERNTIVPTANKTEQSTVQFTEALTANKLLLIYATHTHCNTHICSTPHHVRSSLSFYKTCSPAHQFGDPPLHLFSSFSLVYLEVNLFSYYTRNSERYTDKNLKMNGRFIRYL
jgi:hypothetical protein